MRRFRYILPAALLFALGACSSEEPVAPLPDEPVVTQPSVIDNPSIEAPAQKTVHPDDNIAWFPETGGVTMPYVNGQEITYTLSMSVSATGEETYNATVCMIGGTAANVVIPETLEWTYNRVPTTFKVNGFNLIVVTEGNGNPVGDNIRTITLPKTCVPITSVAVGNMSDNFACQLACGENIEKIYLQEGYPKFCSIDGAVYSEDGKNLVAVPSGRSGQFAAAEGTEIIQANAFRKCDRLDIVTFPASVVEIQDYAFLWTNNLRVINILAPQAPTAPTQAFGYYGQSCVLRVPAAALPTYFPSAPAKPVEPAPLPPEPADDASDAEWDAYIALEEQYYADMEQYQLDLKAYDAELVRIQNMGGYKGVQSIEAWSF